MHRLRKKRPEVCYDLRCATGEALWGGWREDEIAMSVLCNSHSLPNHVQVTHRFSDSLKIIAVEALAVEYLEILQRRSAAQLRRLKAQSWLLMIPDLARERSCGNGWVRAFEGEAVDDSG